MRLFKYEGYNITIEPEAYLLKPFKALWDRDKSKNKEVALMELGFIYFYCDIRSDYNIYTDTEERLKAIKEGEGLPAKWKPDKLVLDAAKFYESFKPMSALLLEDTRFATNKLRQLLRDLDLGETDDKGRPIYTLTSIISTIKQVPALVKELDEAERAVAAEIASNDKARGTVEKSLYEDF